jgi:hypothetical protein
MQQSRLLDFGPIGQIGIASKEIRSSKIRIRYKASDGSVSRLPRKESLNIPLGISSGDDACALCS